MCGIVGYISKNQDIRIGIDALRRLEYRGYDSAGAAWYNSEKGEISCLKKVGRIDNLEKAITESNLSLVGNPLILHTRWATHGGVTEQNAHPHFDCKNEIFLVHNGIIENYRELKEKLIKEGHKFNSECDTEVVPHLIEKYFQGNLEEAVRKALREVRGTYGLAVISKNDPNKIVAARLSSPLLLGINQNEILVASDPSAVITHTRQVIHLDDNEVAVLKPDNFFILKEKPIVQIEWTPEEAQKGGYSHFMLKEIMEEPEAIENAMRGRLILEDGQVRLGGLTSISEKLREINRVILIACGTASFAARVGEYMLEEYAGIPTEVEIGSEFRYRKPKVDKKIFEQNAKEQLSAAIDILKEVKTWDKEDLQKTLQELVKERNWKTGEFFMNFRIAITGSRATPPITDSIVILGREKTLKRLKII